MANFATDKLALKESKNGSRKRIFMEDIKALKKEIRRQTLQFRNTLSKKERAEKSVAISERLFSLANFLEAKAALFYVANKSEVATEDMIRGSLVYGKAVAVPRTNTKERIIVPFKIEDFDQDLIPGYKGILEPDPSRTKGFPVDQIDIAIIPGVAFDTKAGRIGQGGGFYDRLIPTLNITTRKVALGFECQIVQQIPMESHDKHVDIIITEDRTIYKI
jgi:5-formyltetrahydrofolate cyclo-ligase